MMKATLLGTGTSSGVPLIGCDCAVCCSSDVRNRRTRTSLYLEAQGRKLLIDTPPDFREQALRHGLPRVDAVLFTHAHADHIFGFDDIRRFNTLQDCVIPAYADPATMANLRRVFDYISMDRVPGFYRPRIDFQVVEGPFAIGAVEVVPLPVEHGPKPAFGFLFTADGQRLAYIPDCKRLPAEARALIEGADVVILDALRHRPHKTHMTVEESVATLQSLAPRQGYLVHLGHDLDHETLDASLPDGIAVSYDGLVIELGKGGASAESVGES